MTVRRGHSSSHCCFVLPLKLLFVFVGILSQEQGAEGGGEAQGEQDGGPGADDDQPLSVDGAVRG